MANMSYCRFRNTLLDLQDCWYNLYEEIDPEEDKEEFRARRHLVELCEQIADCAEDFEED